MADTLTISVPATMAEQMERARRKENRTRSELLREAWREYFESHYCGYAATRAELAAIRRAARKSAEASLKSSRSFGVTWTVRIANRAEKQLAKIPAKSRRLLVHAMEEMQKDPFQGDIKRLKGERSAWRLRVGARIFGGMSGTNLFAWIRHIRPELRSPRVSTIEVVPVSS
jgi:hypothetical protein